MNLLIVYKFQCLAAFLEIGARLFGTAFFFDDGQPQEGETFQSGSFCSDQLGKSPGSVKFGTFMNSLLVSLNTHHSPWLPMFVVT